MARPFQGKIALDIRDSKPDWDAFLDAKASKDAPNVLVVLFDDTGCAAWSPYGGRIQMPTLDSLAENGLTYSQWHTTSVCSPTRSCFLTGRNHHQNGFGTIAESAAGFPGYAGHIPAENATIATILRNAGYSTFWVGKNHNVPVDPFDIAANRRHWPLGLGYDRFYGFIGGETNQWYPELDVAGQFPDRVKGLVSLWMAEAKKNNVLPLNDYGVVGIHTLEYKATPPENGRYVYYPNTTEVPEASAARTLGSSFKIFAEVDFADDAAGVIVAQGSRFGGYTMFVKSGQLNFVYNFLGIPPEQVLSCAVPGSGRHIVGVEYKKESVTENNEIIGTMTLYVDDKEQGTAEFRTQSGHYALCGEGLAIGYDSGDPVSKKYDGRFPFTGGEIIKVVFDVADDAYVDEERLLAAVLARD